MEPIIAHIDMDCFFCSCEEKRNPTLTGKPVIVGSSGDRGVVSAANYEARKYGVFSATPIAKARRLCPMGIYLDTDKDYYAQISAKIMSILETFADDMEQVSIDEAYLDLTNFRTRFSSVVHMAKYIRKVILNQTGLSASIGVAESRYVAKIASDFKKPAGIIIVTDAKKFLAPLAIGKIPGIGRVSKQYYQQNGVHTIGDLAALDTFKVLDLFGKGGLTFQTVAQGKDKTGLSHREKAKSISRENTFYSSLRDVGLLEQLCNDLCERVYQDLDTMYCKTVSIKVRYSDFQTITRDETLQTPTCSLATIKQAVKNLIRRCIEVGQEIRLIGVKVSNLISFTGQQLLLTDF